MPVFNRASYVGQAIDSVLGQSFADLELIVVDDGSTDGTQSVLDRIDDPRARVLGQPKRGISAALNAGLRVARGRFVARLDSDDLWLPDMLSSQMQLLEARPDAGVAYGKGRAMTADGRLRDATWGHRSRYPDDDLCGMLDGDFTCNITVLARRACFDRAGTYDESMRVNEDWDMWLRVSRHFRFVFNDRELARFRLHDGNTTGAASACFDECVEGRVRVLDKLYAQPDLPPRVLAMRARAYRNLHLAAGLRRFDLGQYRAAAGNFGRALRSGHPVVPTAAHIGRHLLVWKVLNRHPWGRRLLAWRAGQGRG